MSSRITFKRTLNLSKSLLFFQTRVHFNQPLRSLFSTHRQLSRSLGARFPLGVLFLLRALTCSLSPRLETLEPLLISSFSSYPISSWPLGPNHFFFMSFRIYFLLIFCNISVAFLFLTQYLEYGKSKNAWMFPGGECVELLQFNHQSHYYNSTVYSYTCSCGLLGGILCKETYFIA